MKAWFVWIDDEWGDYVHGNTAGQAKSMFLRAWNTDVDDFCSLRPMRVPDLDDKPLTAETISAIREENDPWNEHIICRCKLCETQPDCDN